jgi:hypothetical protein
VGSVATINTIQAAGGGRALAPHSPRAAFAKSSVAVTATVIFDHASYRISIQYTIH